LPHSSASTGPTLSTDICLRAAGSEALERHVLKHSPEAIDAWVRNLRERLGSDPIAIALELDKGPLVYALQKYDGFVLFPINPTMLAKYRQAFVPSGAKDDPTDAELALELLLRHPEALKGLQPQSAPMRSLVQLVHDRRRLVNDRVRITNRLSNALKNYFPQPLEWFEDIDTVLFCDFLTRWPTLKQLKRARRLVLETFFHQHNVRHAAVIEKRIAAIRSALPLTEDPAIIEPQSSSSGPARPSRVRSGQKRSTNSSARKDSLAKPPFAPSHSSGCASSFDAGRSENPTMKPPICSPFSATAHRC
jgi:transposase